jgi:C4-dicarboxylate-specific signal transduction histidine kinase
MFKKEDPEKAPVDLNDLIQEVLGHVRGDSDARNCDPNRADWTTLIGGRQSRQFQQVILNLVRNAADAMASVSDRPRVLRVKSAILLPACRLLFKHDRNPL